MFKEIDREKIHEFVLDAVEVGGGRIVECHGEGDEVVFELGDCEIACPRRGMLLRTRP